MKKYRYMVFIILGVIVCIALIGGGTYAYLLVTTDRKNINTNTGKLEVVYNISILLFLMDLMFRLLNGVLLVL